MNRIKTYTIALLCAAMGVAVPTIAAGQPVAAGREPMTVPYQRFTLANGLTVLVHTNQTVPTVFVGLWYKTGSKDEPPGRSGFAHLFEHLMFQQTANRKGEFIGLMEGAGAVDMNGSTDLDYTNYYETVPTNALDYALWMESDRMGYLDGGITQAVLDEQRRVVENEKRQGALRPEERAREGQLAGFYPAGHPYAHTTIGSTADIEAASLADVKQWFTDHYGASNAVLVLAGDVDLATAKEKVTRYFGAIRPGRPGSKPLQWVPALPAVKRDVVYDQFAGASFSRTWPVANDDPRETTLLQLAARTMAGPITAPLTRALVDQSGIATAVSAEVSENRLGSTFTLSLALRPGVSPDAAGRALDEALGRYLATGPAPERLRAIVTASDVAVLRTMESNAAVAKFLVEGEVGHGDPLFFLKQRDWISRASVAEVRAIAAKWLTRPYYQQDLLPTPGPVAASPVADVDRTRPPPLGPVKTAIAFPPITEMTLANGLKLVVAERHRLPLVDVSMQFDTGTFADAHYAPGAAAAAFGLMTAGSAKFDAAAVARRVSKLGSNIAAMPGERRSGFNWNASTEGLDASFALAADLLRAPLYPQAAVDRLAADVDRRFDMYEQDPMNTAEMLFARAVRGDTDPRGHIDGRDAAKRLSRDAIVRFHDAEVGPRGATLYMIGDITPAAAKRLAERHFGDWRPNTPAAAVDLPPAPPLRARIILVDAPGAGQSSITVGNIVPPFDKDASAAEALANATLASGSSGRLNMNLREDKGWTYGFGGDISDDPAGERVFAAGGSVQVDKTAASMAEIHKDIAEFVSTRPITPVELAENRDAASRSIPLGLTTSGAFFASIISSAALDLPYDRAAGTAGRLAAVTLDDVRRAAVRTYRPDALVWVVIGDLRRIEPGIRALGIAPVEIWDAYGRKVR